MNFSLFLCAQIPAGFTSNAPTLFKLKFVIATIQCTYKLPLHQDFRKWSGSTLYGLIEVDKLYIGSVHQYIKIIKRLGIKLLLLCHYST